MKEYKALVKHRKYEEGKWVLAVPGQRSYSTPEEAMEAIEKAMENGTPRWIPVCNGNDKTYSTKYWDDLEVIDSKVMVREVTEWEELA